MTDFLLIVIVCQLAYVIHYMKKPEKGEKTSMDYSKVMPQYIGKECELILKEALYAIDIMYSVTGKIIDCDEAWVVIEVTDKKKTVQKIIQISNIGSLKEIK
ncbi:MAG: hypothetical protein IJ307_00920 [Bacteroidales bacterium]|nr:hypothetical protein [Bacteroidales bacterium]